MKYAPKQPLSATPKYESYHVIHKLGPKEQFVYYQNGEQMRARSNTFLRIGLPYYFVRAAEKMSLIVGKNISPRLHRDIMGRFHLISSLYKVRELFVALSLNCSLIERLS